MSKDTLTVYAIRDGFYEAYRRPGDRFTIENPDVAFSKRWMVPADTAEGNAFIKRHNQQENAAKDAITGERLQSGGQAEELVLMRQQMAELKATINELNGKSLGAKANTQSPPAAAPKSEAVPTTVMPTEPAADEQPAAPAKARRRRAAS